ncbi:MAG: hypothetical protein GY795_17235, partial [Desulfobacterales bacterium]|nr:hypothetical protein [Desulfobacterales bacterium]
YPPTDLVVTDLNIPGSGASGKSVDITYSVRNNEQGATLESRWHDRLYFSSDTELDTSKDILLKEISHGGSLAWEETYSATVSVNLPDGFSGDHYLIIEADGNERVSESNEDNNTSYSLISVELTPPPDLQVAFYEIPSQGLAGQPLEVTWTVQNKGVGIADIETWYDGVFLSLDNVLDRSDTRLKTVPHSGFLDPGDNYSTGAEVELPIFASGSYFLLIKTDSGENVYEHDAEGNNVVSGAVSITIPPPSDLIVTDIVVPATAFPGDMITVSWTVRNIGENSATGIMRDGVYLSDDEEWDIEDPLLGYIDYEISIPAGGSRTVRKSMSLARAARSDSQGEMIEEMPGILPDKYHAIVRTDLRNNIFENNDSNNTAYSSGQTDVNFKVLQIGTADSGTLTQNQSIFYAVDASAGATLLVSLDSESTSAFNELFVSYSQVPSSRQFEFGYDTPLGADQNIVIPQAQEGRYYIMINGSSASVDPQSFTIQVSLLEFDVFEIDVTEGGQGGPATIKLQGARFTQNMQVWLQDGEDSYESERVYYQDSSVVCATFDLGSVPLGNYDIVIADITDDIQTNEHAKLENCFNVAEPRYEPFEMHINAPSATRVNQNFAYKIEYANPSNNDMVSPFLVLGGEPHFDKDLPAYSELAEDTHKIRAVSSDGPAYILRPGTTGSVSVKAQSPDMQGIFYVNASPVQTKAPKWATQDLFIFESIRINSEGREVELIDKIIAKALSQTEPRITFPGGAKFIPTSAIDGRALDIDNYSLHNTEVIPGILEVEGNYLFSVLTSSDLNIEAETIGISDALDIDLTTILPDDVKVGDIGMMDYTLIQFLPSEDPTVEHGLSPLQIAIERSKTKLQYLSIDGSNLALVLDKQFIVASGSKRLRVFAKYAGSIILGGFTGVGGGSIIPGIGSVLGGFIGIAAGISLAYGTNSDGDETPENNNPSSPCPNPAPVYPSPIGPVHPVGPMGPRPIFLPIDNRGPIDPNDITGPEGYGEKYWISISQNMFYTIRFENDPELATAPAQVVTIRQTLDSDLDPRTFRLGSFGFGEHVFNVPENTSYYSDRLDMTDSFGIYVDVNAGIDINTNEVFWIFRSIDPATGQAPTDPFAGFLPVNDPETHVGEGFVNYTIKAKETAVTGDVIDAQARIIFDVNDPIDTPPIFNTIDADLPSSQLENSTQPVNETTFT